MRKKRIARNVWNGVKVGTGLGVGLCTDVALGYAMFKGAPAGMSKYANYAYRVGAAGTSMVAGSLATELTIGQIGSAEDQFKKRMRKAKKDMHRKKKKGNHKEHYKENEHKVELVKTKRDEKTNEEIIISKVEEINEKKKKEKNK